MDPLGIGRESLWIHGAHFGNHRHTAICHLLLQWQDKTLVSFNKILPGTVYVH